MFCFHKTGMLLLCALAVPVCANAADFCVAVSGGFGNGGTSYVAPGFKLPGPNHCQAWAGFTKTASNVVAISTGTGCLASDGKVLTLSIFNTDPSFFGAGASASDQVQLCPTGTAGCPISGQDAGYFDGSAVEQTCTSGLLKLPPSHS